MRWYCGKSKWILSLFGSVLIEIQVPYNDATLVDFVFNAQAGGGTAAASPYVIAMTNLKINGLPHLVNALMLTSIFSAGSECLECSFV